MKLQQDISALLDSISPINISRYFVWIKSSLSTKVIYLPLESSQPLFLALERPPFSQCRTFIFSDLEAYSSHIFPDESFEPSLINISSKFV